MNIHIENNCRAFHQCAISLYVSSNDLIENKNSHIVCNWMVSLRCAPSYVFLDWPSLSKNNHIDHRKRPCLLLLFWWQLSHFVHHRQKLQSMNAESWFLKTRYSQVALNLHSGQFLAAESHCQCFLEHYRCFPNLCQSLHSKNVGQGCWKDHVWNPQMMPKLSC